MRLPRRGALAALAPAAAGLLIAGCGSGQLKPATGLNPAYQLLSDRAIQKTAAGPVRALYQWWHSIQYNDLTGYLDMLAPGLRAQELHSQLLDYELPVSSRVLDAALPYVVSVSRTGPQATIYTLVAYHQLVGASQFVTVQAPQAFALTQIGDRWYIADDHFVAEQSRQALVTAGVIPESALPATKTAPAPAAANPAVTGQPSAPGAESTRTTSALPSVTTTTTGPARRPATTTAPGAPTRPTTTTTTTTTSTGTSAPGP